MNLKNIFAFNALLLFLAGCLICLACFDIIQNVGSQRKLDLESPANYVSNHTTTHEFKSSEVGALCGDV